MGAIVDPSQRKSVDALVKKAREEGANVFQKCACIPEAGCYYPPTLITNVQPVSTVVQEEVGGASSHDSQMICSAVSSALVSSKSMPISAMVYAHMSSCLLEEYDYRQEVVCNLLECFLSHVSHMIFSRAHLPFYIVLILPCVYECSYNYMYAFTRHHFLLP